MGNTRIDWADKVWNPVTGCTKVSEGCKNCYAERMSKRLAGRAGYPEDGFKVALHPDRLNEPLYWKKPSRIFVCSMGDLFHENVTLEYIGRVLKTARACPQHTFLFLTKRPHRMRDALLAFDMKGDTHGILCKHLWFGVSIENQKTADERMPVLLQMLAANRYVSYEPAIGEVDFELACPPCSHCNHPGNILQWPCPYCKGRRFVWPDWIIMGGESGPGARPLHPDWARSVRDQCKVAGVPFWFKQWGEFRECTEDEYMNANPSLNNRRAFDDGVEVIRVGKKAAGCLLDGKEYKETP